MLLLSTVIGAGIVAGFALAAAHPHPSIATVACARDGPHARPSVSCPDLPRRQRRGFSFRGVSQAGHQIAAVTVVLWAAGGSTECRVAHRRTRSGPARPASSK
jgi:hypothetical protein